MLVLALEFSRGSTARAATPADCTVVGYARGERLELVGYRRLPASPGHGLVAAPSKRKSEARRHLQGPDPCRTGDPPRGVERRSGIRWRADDDE
jgi:hypothetical protein